MTRRGALLLRMTRRGALLLRMTRSGALLSDLVGDGDAGGRVDELAFEEVLLDLTSRANDDARQQANHLVPGDVDACWAGARVGDRCRQIRSLGARRVLGRQLPVEGATSARPDRGDELVDEGAADDGDFRFRLALERVEREGDLQR